MLEIRGNLGQCQSEDQDLRDIKENIGQCDSKN
jgi:hypothetical protein